MTLAVEWTNVLQVDEVFDLTKQSYQGHGWSKAVFAADLSQPTAWYFGGRIDGKLIAYVSASLVLDELSITNVAVAPDWQQQGIGRSLMMRCLDQFKQPLRILLEVRTSNQKAQKLYHHLGFETYYIRENYYQNPVEAAQLMDLKINGWGE